MRDIARNSTTRATSPGSPTAQIPTDPSSRSLLVVLHKTVARMMAATSAPTHVRLPVSFDTAVREMALMSTGWAPAATGGLAATTGA